MRRLLITAFLLAAASAGTAVLARWWITAPAGSSLPQPPPTASPGLDADWLHDVTDDRKLDFRYPLGTPGRYFFPEIMAGGLALFDFDSDGDLDIYVINVGLPPNSSDDPPAGRPVNRLYRQEADGTFLDVTKGSGLDDSGYGQGVAVGDVNNDGRPDVLVTNYGPDRLFLNRGDGKFRDVTADAGIDNLHWGTSATMLDYDRDGWLDLFVTNYVDYDPSRPCLDGTGVKDYCNPQLLSGTSDQLYRNLGASGTQPGGKQPDGTTVSFEDVSLPSAIARKPAAGLGVVSLDFNLDRWPDLYVANDGQANHLWINQHDGTFRDEAMLMGVAYDSLGRGQASMGIAMGDLNFDGRFELLCTHLDGETNALYESGDDGLYDEVAHARGLAVDSFPLTGFGTALLDVDHDGDLDLAVVNGRVKRPRGDAPAASAEDFWSKYAEPNQLFINEGDHRSPRFRRLDSADDDFDKPRETSRALAIGDLDNDGDLDLVVTNIGGRLRIYRNDAEKKGNWLQLRAVDPRWGGRDALGAVITVTAGERSWIRAVQPASSYLSSHDVRVHFGLGNLDRVDSIQVRWPDGTEQTFPGGPVNQLRLLERQVAAE